MVILAANNRSINSAGTGTMITRTLAIMPIGSIRSWIRAQEPGAAPRGTAAEDIRCSRLVDKERESTQNGPKCPGRFVCRHVVRVAERCRVRETHQKRLRPVRFTHPTWNALVKNRPNLLRYRVSSMGRIARMEKLDNVSRLVKHFWRHPRV